jgi:hypothetical protein
VVLQGRNYYSRIDIWNTNMAIVFFNLGYQLDIDMGQQQKIATNLGSI